MSFIVEHRKVFLFKEVGPNIREWAHDVNKQYISGPWQRKDNFQKIVGPPMAGLSAIFEGTDQIWSGIVDQKLEQPQGMFGRITRDTRLFVKNVFTLHPLRALGDGFRLLTSDPLLDAGDAIGGFRSQTRKNIQHALAA